MLSIPITILHGFLGSGKTTLLRSILSQSQSAVSRNTEPRNTEHKSESCVPSVIVNDMSELDIDGVLVLNTDVVNENHGNFVTISGDSVSSPEGIKKLDEALNRLIQSKRPPWIVIETSGSSHPLPLVEFFKDRSEFALKGVVTLVDSTWLKDDYDHGKALIPKWQENLQNGVRSIENLLVEQIMFSNRVLLTKTDRLNENSIKSIAESLHPLNPYTSIESTSWGNIGIDTLKEIEDYNFFMVEQLISELRDGVNAPLTLSGKHNQKIVAKVIKDDRPFHPQRLWQTCHRYLTQGVFRSKGFFWMPTRDDVSLLWSQTNGSVGLEIVGFWRASVLQDETQQFTPEQLDILQTKIDSAQSRFGDRRCRLTVIGQNDEVDTFIEALNRCFLTEDELEQWKDGATFDDPWPKKVAKV